MFMAQAKFSRSGQLVKPRNFKDAPAGGAAFSDCAIRGDLVIWWDCTVMPSRKQLFMRGQWITLALTVFAAISLTLAEPATTAVTDCIAPSPALVGWWPGDGNNHDLAGTNNAIMVNTTFAPGRVESAFSFDGPDSYVQIPKLGVGFASPFSIEAWVWHATNAIDGQRYITLTPDATYLSYDTRGYGKGFGFALATGDTVVVLTSDIPVEPQKWYHLAGIYDGTNQTFYVNGAPVAFATIGHPIQFGANGDWLLNFPGSLVTHTRIDEPAVYKRALTAGEVQAHFNAGASGFCKTVQFTEIHPMFPATVLLGIKGPPSKTLDFQFSADLTKWSLLSTVSNFTGQAQYSDTAAGGSKQRFYRVVVP
jgi:hypothetical protein